MKSTVLAYAQLVRLPNVFTSMADIALGAFAAGYLLKQPDTFALLLVGSSLLYLAGMALNDFFDRAEDGKARPFRPIPSGRVSARMAALVGFGLLFGGAFTAMVAKWEMPFPILPVALAVSIVLYDGLFKATPLAPLAMGTCRFVNVLMGLSGGGVDVWAGPSLHLAGAVGVYIVGVTMFAKTEEGESQPRALSMAGVVILAGLLLGLTVPMHNPAGMSWVLFPYALIAFGFWVGVPVVNAIRKPGPKQVQTAVKRCVLGLIAFDAILATAYVGFHGLLILLLLLPAYRLGKWVYST